MSLLPLLGSLIMLLCAAGWGRLVRRGNSSGSASERLVVDAALGLGIMSLFIFVLGIIDRIYMSGFVALGAFGLVSIAKDIWQVLRNFARNCRRWKSVLIGALLVLLAVAALIPALAPPSMSDWDSLAYHLAVPKLYLQHGGIYYINFTTHSNFPFLMEMLYIPALIMNSPVMSKLMNYFMGVLLIGAVVVLVRKHITPKAANMAAIAVAGMPLVLWEATTAYVDLSTALFTVLAVHMLLNYFDSSSRRDLVMCAVFTGFAASTKMTGLALIPLLAIWLFVDRRVAEKKFKWADAGILAGVAILVCSPWYIKSFIYTGNPVYPFFYSIFGGRDWSATLANNYTMLQSKFGMGHSFGSFMFLPYYLTFRSDAFYDRPGLFIGPILLAAMPILFFAKYGSRKLVGLLLFFIAQLVIWFSLSQQSRYLIPAFAVLAALVSGLVYQDDRLRRARVALMTVFVATALFGLLTLWPSITNTAAVAIGLESNEAYLNRTLDIYPADKYINETLPKTAKIALFGDTRGFYLDRPYVWADWGHNAEFSRKFTTPAEMMTYLKSRGVTHALINFGISFPTRNTATENAAIIYEAIDSGLLREVHATREGRVVVYEII